MAEVILPDRSVYEPTTSEEHVAVTTPQGTQANSVESGHESRDINFKALAGWLAATLAMLFITYVIVLGMFNTLAWFQTRKDVVPSPMFGVQTVPPEPRLFPNPADTRTRTNDPMAGPGERMVEERKLQDDQMKALGMYDPGSGQYRIPESAIDSVAAQGTPGSTVQQGTMMPVPSDSSGGRNMENGLR